jgi:hypothetical protein
VTLNDANQARLVRVERTNGLSDPAAWRQRYPPPVFDLVQDDGLFHAVRCAQGNLGIMYAVTVRTRPAFLLEETRTLTTWRAAWPDLQRGLVDPAAHSLHAWINPYLTNGKTDLTVLVTDDEPDAAGGVRAAQRVDGAAVPQFISAYRPLNPNGFFDGPLERQLGLRDIAQGR